MEEKLRGSKQNPLTRGPYNVWFERDGWHYGDSEQAVFYSKPGSDLKAYRFIVDDRHADAYTITVYATTPPPADAVAASYGYESEFDGTFSPDF